MKDYTNLCPMCKLPVKALEARETHAQPLLQRAELLAGDRTNFSNHDSEQSVLWD